ncbi:hypothetical protein HY468_00760 [Candidatus Roizmanbacteria bacterium]|nr:hypothetical protein [Candidatus Roizmanbacteria bacterium]
MEKGRLIRTLLIIASLSLVGQEPSAPAAQTSGVTEDIASDGVWEGWDVVTPPDRDIIIFDKPNLPSEISAKTIFVQEGMGTSPTP